MNMDVDDLDSNQNEETAELVVNTGSDDEEHGSSDEEESDFDGDDDAITMASESGEEPAALDWYCDACARRSTIRYHSGRIIDYDVCGECYQEKYQYMTLADAFHLVPIGKEWEFFCGMPMTTASYGWEDLLSKLSKTNNEQVQNLEFGFDEWDSDPVPSSDVVKDAVKAMAPHSSLKCLTLQFEWLSRSCWERNGVGIVKFLREGILANKSIIRLCISLDLYECPDATIRSICHLIRHTTSLQYLIICDLHYDHSRHMTPMNRQLFRLVRNSVVNDVAIQFFEALGESSSSLYSMVLEAQHAYYACGSPMALDEKCRKAAIHAMKTCPNIRNIQANFKKKTPSAATGSGNDHDHDELEQLVQDRKQKWMRFWNGPTANSESRCQVLQEILACKRLNHQDQVAALFHFIQSNPAALAIPGE